MNIPTRVMKPGRVRCGWFCLAAAAVLLLSSPPALGADVTWTLATTGDWSNTGNWSNKAVPTSDTNVGIFIGGTAIISTTGNTCGNFSLGNTTGSGSVQVNGGGALSVSGSAFVGYSGNGTCSVNGSGNLSAPWEYVGYSGTGNFTQSGGTNAALRVISTSATTPAAAEPTASAVPAWCRRWYEYVGYSGAGSFTQSGGTNRTTSEVIQL